MRIVKLIYSGRRYFDSCKSIKQQDRVKKRSLIMFTVCYKTNNNVCCCEREWRAETIHSNNWFNFFRTPEGWKRAWVRPSLSCTRHKNWDRCFWNPISSPLVTIPTSLLPAHVGMYVSNSSHFSLSIHNLILRFHPLYIGLNLL